MNSSTEPLAMPAATSQDVLTDVLRDGAQRLLAREIFYTLLEAKVLIERWREHYNRVRPDSSLGYRPPAPEVVIVSAPAGGLPPRSPLQNPSGKHRRGIVSSVAGCDALT